MFSAVPLFLAGVAVALWVLPKGLALLIGFTPEGVSNFLAVDAYLSFLVRTMIVFGIGFLVPVFIVGLNLVGILQCQCHQEILALDGPGSLHLRRRRNSDR